MPISKRSLENGGGQKVAATAKPRTHQRGQRDDPKQRAHMRKNLALGIRYAPNRMHVRSGQHFLDLVADRRNVGRAEPAVVFSGRQRFGIAIGQRVGWLGERADEKLPKLTGMAGEILRDGKEEPGRRCPRCLPWKRFPLLSAVSV